MDKISTTKNKCLLLGRLVTMSSNWTRISDEEKQNVDVRMDFIWEILSEQKIEFQSNKTVYRICDQNGSNCQQTGRSLTRENIS